MALVDLWFASAKIKKEHSCSSCPKVQQDKRGCHKPEFNNYKSPKKLDKFSLEYYFCPGKAIRSALAAKLFQECRVALETGILPNRGCFLDQNEYFVEVFPSFVERWKTRQYNQIWIDISEILPKVDGIARMLSLGK